VINDRTGGHSGNETVFHISITFLSVTVSVVMLPFFLFCPHHMYVL
jgi:hypothetical protein